MYGKARSGPSPSSSAVNNDNSSLNPSSIFLNGKFEWKNTEAISTKGAAVTDKKPKFLHARLDKDDKKKTSSAEKLNTWDDSHVKLPCSTQNILHLKGKPVKAWDIISSSLSGNIRSVEEFAQAVYSYNPEYSRNWNFDHLKQAFRIQPSFLPLLPKIARLALRLPELIKKPIPLLRCGVESSITFTQLQIACLLANAFYSTFPLRNSPSPQSEYVNFPYINFGYFFSTWALNRVASTVQKILCVLHYFDCILADDFSGGVVTFSRRCISDPPSFESSDVKFNSIAFGVSTTCLIEDAHPNTIQVDFADPFLGGQILRGGCVQEEITFCIRPELFVGMLFMEAMESNEAIIIEGSQRFSRYEGYTKTFKWSGGFDEIKDANNSRTTDGHWKGAIVAIDAQHYRKGDCQFTKECIRRELNKAYLGFSDEFVPYRPLSNVVVSGNWGCGVFKGLIQLMACAQAGKSLAYCTFTKDDFGKRALEVFTKLCGSSCSVGKLWNILAEMPQPANARPQVFELALQQLENP